MNLICDHVLEHRKRTYEYEIHTIKVNTHTYTHILVLATPSNIYQRT